MTENQFNEIKQRLAKWRKKRHLTYENQIEGLAENVFKKVSEYFRAKDDLEKADALCNIAVFLFNSIDLDYESYHNFKMYTAFEDDFFYIYGKLGNVVRNKIYNGTNVLSAKVNSELISILDTYFRDDLKLDFYECMIKTIKEIESRTGAYDENLKKEIDVLEKDFWKRSKK
ncbi:hypothetical protein [Campylobacter molothri]|uniref:Uncharacterized protein n=2 Tax=Campylobacter molothri TaxID=1032242 RepID=A0ACC5W2H1_9BACT|nr:hypothetical protein [Campylobacter sp. RM9754]